MTASSSPPPTSAWVADPVRDFLCFRLIELAVAALDTIFAEEAHEQAYRDWLADAKPKPGGRRGAAKRRPATSSASMAMLELNVWRRAEGYAVRVLAMPQRAQFLIVLEEEHFKAEVVTVYDPESLNVVSASIESFTGDQMAAIRVAGQFIEKLDELAESDDSDLAALVGVRELGLADTGAASMAAQVGGIISRLVATTSSDRLREGVTAEEELFLANNPEALWVLRDGFIENASAKRRSQPSTVAAWQIVLERQLEEIRFKAERQHDWAIAMLDRYQGELLAMARQPGVDVETWQALVIALDRAKIVIKPEIRAASVELVSGAVQAMPATADIVRSMEEIVETGGGDPFRIASHMFDAMTMMPSDFADFAVSAIAEAPLPALRDVLPLVLLAPEANCRQAAAAALERMAIDKRLTTAGLRRLITLRSWLPECERRTVDQAIRRARLAGVDCAPWPAGQIRSLVATLIDGSGCQSLLAVAKDGNRHIFAGILTKQGFGIRDVLAERSLSRREGDAMLTDVGSQVLSRPIARSYLDCMVQHALFTGVEANRTAPLALLEVAEALGAAEWRAERLNAEAELERLLAGLPAELTSTSAVAETLANSRHWSALPDLTDSWFEDDEGARDLCTRHRRAPKKAVAAVLASVIEPRRSVWAERLVWMAMWAGSQAAGTGAVAPGLPRWHEYALVARALYEGRPLAEVPLMGEIARQTVASAG